MHLQCDRPRVRIPVRPNDIFLAFFVPGYIYNRGGRRWFLTRGKVEVLSVYVPLMVATPRMANR